MRLRGVWLVLFVLAGCGSGSPGDGPEAVCRRQANDDPAVKHFAVENLGPASANPDVQYDYDKALRDATNACLRQKGIQVRGGVEQVRP